MNIYPLIRLCNTPSQSQDSPFIDILIFAALFLNIFLAALRFSVLICTNDNWKKGYWDLEDKKEVKCLTEQMWGFCNEILKEIKMLWGENGDPSLQLVILQQLEELPTCALRCPRWELETGRVNHLNYQIHKVLNFG